MKMMQKGSLLLALAAVAACAKSEPVTADPDEVAAAVNKAHEEASSIERSGNSD